MTDTRTPAQIAIEARSHLNAHVSAYFAWKLPATVDGLIHGEVLQPGRVPKLDRYQLVSALKRVSGGAPYDADQLRTVAKQAWKMLKADGPASEGLREFDDSSDLKGSF